MVYDYPEQPIEQPIEEGNSVTAPSDREESPEIGIIRELSPKKVMEQLRMNMKGYFWDYEKKGYIRIIDPLMNDLGIAKYLSIVSSVVTDLLTFSSFKEEEIKELVLYVCDKAIPTIHVNYKGYGIKDKSDLQIIDIQIFNLTNSAFHKAIGGGDRSVVRGTVNEAMISRNFQQPQRNPNEQGFLSKLNPFK
jgi:hypothetical protein